MIRIPRISRKFNVFHICCTFEANGDPNQHNLTIGAAFGVEKVTNLEVSRVSALIDHPAPNSAIL